MDDKVFVLGVLALTVIGLGTGLGFLLGGPPGAAVGAKAGAKVALLTVGGRSILV